MGRNHAAGFVLRILVACVGLCLTAPAAPAQGLRGEGYGYIDTPREGQPFEAGPNGKAVVPCRSSGQGVGIRGADPHQLFNVSWLMAVTVGGGVVVGAPDIEAVAIVQCDGEGRWDRLANGTGIISGQVEVAAPGGKCTLLSSLSNNAGGQPHADYEHAHNFSVVAQQGGGGGGGN